mgnify:CR=1 FL=1
MNEDVRNVVVDDFDFDDKVLMLGLMLSWMWISTWLTIFDILMNHDEMLILILTTDVNDRYDEVDVTVDDSC